MPPLRERIEDVPDLAVHFLGLYGRRAENVVTSIDDDALLLLKAYHWPGNVRELENVIERAVLIAESPVITPTELPDELTASALRLGSGGHDLGGWEIMPSGKEATAPELAVVFQAHRTERERRERDRIIRALAATGGNKAEAARSLGMKRSTLVSRLKRLGLG